jgi:acyl dehydratase
VLHFKFETAPGKPLYSVTKAFSHALRLADGDRRVELTSELFDEEIAAVEASEMDPGFDHLDAELAVKPATDKNAAD